MYRILSLSLVLGTLLSGCNTDKGWDCSKKAGKSITVVRNTGAFKGIAAGEKFDVLLMQDTTQPESVTITYGENLVPEISTEIKDGILTIEDRNTCNFVRNLSLRPRVLVNLHHLEYLEIRGSATLKTLDTLFLDRVWYKTSSVNEVNLNIRCDWFMGNCSNSCRTVMNGSAVIFSLGLDDASSLDARNLDVSDAYLYYYSPVDSYLSASSIFDVNIYGLGNVFYNRTPQHKFSVYEPNKGKLIRY